LNTVELENAVLRDPSTYSGRKYSTKANCSTHTSGTSGHFLFTKMTQVSLQPRIKIINKSDLNTSHVQLGEGRFGKCFLGTYSHFKVCAKFFKKPNNSLFIWEANIVSQFTHPNLPYLFGVTIDEPQLMITSFHGVNDQSVTLHCVLSKTSLLNEISVDWHDVLRQVACGLECLHNKYEIIHNDLKGDNVVLSSSQVCHKVKPVIIDFGKACESTKGKAYRLTEKEKRKYESLHNHIAPDLRDGLCPQSVFSDVYSFGRLVSKVVNSYFSEHQGLHDLSAKCMEYNSGLRPNLHSILQTLEG